MVAYLQDLTFAKVPGYTSRSLSTRPDSRIPFLSPLTLIAVLEVTTVCHK